MNNQTVCKLCLVLTVILTVLFTTALLAGTSSKTGKKDITPGNVNEFTDDPTFSDTASQTDTRVIPQKPWEQRIEDTRIMNVNQKPEHAQPSGYLEGKNVFIHPGHGWYYLGDPYGWMLQRSLINHIIEDHNNAEAVNYYLNTYLWNAGANVYPCREWDMNPNMVVIDNSDPGYSETGTWTTVENPGAFNGDYRQTLNSSEENASANFIPEIPEDGYYRVYLWYVSEGDNAEDVHIRIRHSGGTSTWTQNMQTDGYTYLHLGQYYFLKGRNPGSGAVTISNESDGATGMVVADAVRFGGGIGDEIIFDEPEPSMRPRFEQAVPYYANFMGCTECGSNKYRTAPLYAAWANEPGDDSIYVSWHTNSTYSSSVSGSIAYVYSSLNYGYPFDGVPGSVELAEFVQEEIANDIHAQFDPSWKNRSVKTANFAEINPNLNSEMPSILLELAFRSNYMDSLALRNPQFNRTVARAIYQGIVRYFSERDEVIPFTLPEPPTHLTVTNSDAAGVILSWNPSPFDAGDGLLGDPATGYKVYRSTNGYGFDTGTVVEDADVTKYIDKSATPGKTFYYRVTAVNAGGESFPTETLTVLHDSRPSKVLIVSGYDRLDHGLSVVEHTPSGEIHRMIPERMNSYRYTIPYAEALGEIGLTFDSASNEAVKAGLVEISHYRAVIWYTGNEFRADHAPTWPPSGETPAEHTFEAEEQAILQHYLSTGGNLFINGAEIALDLDSLRNGADFYNEYLKATFASDDAETYTVNPVVGGIFDGLATFDFDDGSYGEYNTEFPDVLNPVNGSTACLTYGNSSGDAAGIQYNGPSFRVVNFGFPFETIHPEEVRLEVLHRIMDYFGLAGKGKP